MARILSGENPQIPKGKGNKPVQAYLDAIPGWKQAAARRLDALIERVVPGVQKAVKWNSPFYGQEDGLWFLSFHCTNNYLKVAFFQGVSLDPPPPEPSKQKEVRYLHIREGESDEARWADWIEQASRLPGVKM